MSKGFSVGMWGRPRSHMEIDEARAVTFLELFYDLVFVLVVSRAADLLLHEASAASVVDFFVSFGLIWIAWVNGTLYLDYHGRQDLRTRFFTFLQMFVFTLISFYASEPLYGNAGFVLWYSVFIGIMIWLWVSVLREDFRQGHRQFTRAVVNYQLLLVFTALAVYASSVLPPASGRALTAGIVIVWLVAVVLLNDLSRNTFKSTPINASTAERFALFIIIVLGEVVVGVANGIHEFDGSLRIIVTSALVLFIGFGLWWNYFDYVGLRIPRNARSGFPVYIVAHFPLSLAITAIGAISQLLIRYSADSVLPRYISLILAGSLALFVLALELSIFSLERSADSARSPRLTAAVMFAGAATALVLAVLPLRSLAFLLSVFALLFLLWLFKVLNSGRKSNS